MRKLLIGFILSLTLLIGCGPKFVSIESATTGVRAASLGLSVLEDITIELYSADAITNVTALAIMDFSFSANTIGLEASKFIRTLSEINSDDKRRLEKIIEPLLDSLDTLMDEKIIHIPNPIARERIQTALFMVRLAITSMGDF